MGFWKRFFMVLGIVFFVLILLVVIALSYVAIAKPFGVDPSTISGALTGAGDVQESSYDHPVLTEEQEIFLENAGVDTTQIPAEITAEQEACAVEKLGQKRVDEIKAGASFQVSDYLKAGSCLR
jgi:hypothetical protein